MLNYTEMSALAFLTEVKEPNFIKQLRITGREIHIASHNATVSQLNLVKGKPDTGCG